MLGRDPGEPHRAATPLELLFDLTFVIAFGIAGNELAHFLAEGHFGAGIGGFLFAIFGIAWAWINFSWFASAYDTDDWVFRLPTMVQMVGVLIFALGLPAMFASLEHGAHVDNSVMVLGYVVMRVPMVVQWLRAARAGPGAPERLPDLRRDDPDRAGRLGRAGGGRPVDRGRSSVVAVLMLIEVTGPAIAETPDGRHARGTPTTSPSATACWSSSRSARA